MIDRTKVVQFLRDHRETVGENLADLWRRQAEDMIAAGISRKDVAETMISVALVQGMLAHGASVMVEALRRQAEVFEVAAEQGVEYPVANPFKH